MIAMVSGIPLVGWAKPVPVDMRHFREPRRSFAIVAAASALYSFGQVGTCDDAGTVLAAPQFQ